MNKFSHVLHDPQTKDLAFKVATFNDGTAFDHRSRSNYFTLLLVTEGIGTVQRDEVEYGFEKSCLMCFAIYQPFKIVPDNKFAGVSIQFHPSFFCLHQHRHEVSCNGVLFNNLYDTPVVKLNAAEQHTLSAICSQMAAEMQQVEQPDVEILISYLKILLIQASRLKMAQRQTETANTGKIPLTVERLKNAIETHFKTLRSPGDYGGLLHLSAKALNQAAKQYFNKTLTSLIAERVMIEAKRELYLTAKPVKQIAFELGYTDEFYFSRIFKKQVGVSPRIFREKVGFDKLNA